MNRIGDPERRNVVVGVIKQRMRLSHPFNSLKASNKLSSGEPSISFRRWQNHLFSR